MKWCTGLGAIGFLFLCSCAPTPSDQKKVAQVSFPIFELRLGLLSLVEVDAEKGLLPASPRMLDSNYFVPSQSSVTSPLVAMTQGNISATWGGARQSDTYVATLGDGGSSPYSAAPFDCKIGTALSPLLLILQSVASSGTEQFPKPVTVPLAISSLSSCELKSTLGCFVTKVSLASEDGLAGLTPLEKGKVLEKIAGTFKDCGKISEFDPGGDTVFFRFGAADVAFEPSPLYAISIYEGSQSNYDVALTSLNPAANFPANVGCHGLVKGCLISPLPFSKCQNCSMLKPGTLYTAFLLREAFERHENVKHVVFRVPDEGNNFVLK